ncbi:septum formation initiator family protein, partial [Vibrio parahaemolyticus]|nr:septum formation initiator family protein [Vibrio parahaemolyticus]
MIAEKINYERIEELPEKKIEKKVQKRSVVNKTSYILVSICFLLSSIFLLKGYSDIQIMRYEINQLQKQKNNLTQQKEDLYVRLEGLKNNQEIGK